MKIKVCEMLDKTGIIKPEYIGMYLKKDYKIVHASERSTFYGLCVEIKLCWEEDCCDTIFLSPHTIINITKEEE